jgi:cytochrome d ubiquinol oxidase subunit I
LLLLFGLSFWYSVKGSFTDKPWLLRWAVWFMPMPWIAARWAGSWPNTAASPGPSTACCPPTCPCPRSVVGSLYGSLAGFIGFYTLLLVVEMYLMFKFARLGPGSLGTGRYTTSRTAAA